MPDVDQAPPAFPLDKWLDAWTVGVRAYWPTPSDEIRRLLSIRESVRFTAPEQLVIRVRQAWEVYTDLAEQGYQGGDTGDHWEHTETGARVPDRRHAAARAAVALTYILNAARQS